MVVTIFRSRLSSDFVGEYEEVAKDMLDLATRMPGYRSIKTFTAEDGERVSIVEFESLPELEAWRDHPEHRRAQELGRKKFYSEYHLQVCTPIRSYSFKDGRREAHSVETGTSTS